MPKEIYNLPTRKEKYLTEQEVRAIVISSMENFQGNFRIKSGSVKADGGTIESGSGNSILKVDGTNGLWLGNADFSSAPFRVSLAGALVATSAEIEGKITATSGEIGGWDIGATTLSATSITLDSGNEKITVGASNPITIDGANKKIESDNYVSGYAGSGFYIDEDKAEFGNIACRGLIRTSVFQKDVISAMGGNFMVLDSDVLDADMTADDDSDLTTKGTTTFATGDILRIKDGTDDEWLEVTAVNGNTYTVTRDKAGAYGADDNPVWKKGATVVNYGQSGDGGVYMTASESNAPYLSVFTHSGSPWTDLTTRLRIGNLNGYLGYTSDKYGIGIGDTNYYLKYDPTNHLQIKGNVDIIGGDAYDKLEANLPSDENLVGYWSFDEGKGDKAYDGSGNGNDGTLTNMADDDWVDGVAGSALDFDGSNDYVEVADNGSLNITGNITILAWIKLDTLGSGQQQYIVGKTETELTYAIFIESDDTVRCILQGLNDTYPSGSPTAITDTNWHQVAISYDGEYIRTFLDGKLQISDDSSGNINSSTDKIYIGIRKYSNSCYFNGKIDEVRIYNKALTAAEVYALYKNPAGQPSLAVPIGRLTAGTIYSKQITLAVADGTGDSYIAGGNNLDLTNWRGGDASGGAVILGLDDSDSNKGKFFAGNYSTSKYMQFDGEDVKVGGRITATAGSDIPLAYVTETFTAAEDISQYEGVYLVRADASAVDPSDDTYIDESQPDNSYCSAGYAYVTHGTNKRYALFKFSLTGHDNASNYKTILRLKIYSAPTNTMTCYIYKVNSDWSESSCPTWNNQPTFDTYQKAYFTVQAYSYDDIDVDVTELFRQWNDGNNYGLVIKASTAVADTVGFKTSENADPSQLLIFDNNSSNVGKIKKAKADDSLTCTSFVGVAAEDISNGSSGKVRTLGKTTAKGNIADAGLPAYVAPSAAGEFRGGLTSVDDYVVKVGVVRQSGNPTVELVLSTPVLYFRKFNISCSSADATEANNVRKQIIYVGFKPTLMKFKTKSGFGGYVFEGFSECIGGEDNVSQRYVRLDNGDRGSGYIWYVDANNYCKIKVINDNYIVLYWKNSTGTSYMDIEAWG